MNTDILNKDKLTASIAAIVGSVKAKDKDAATARGDDATALSRIRTLASEVIAAEADVKAVATLLSASMVAAGVKRGTATPYATAFRGFAYATKDGKDVVNYEAKGDTGKFRAMTSGEARSLAAYTEMTQAERDEAEAAAEVQAVRDEITKRVKAISDKAALETFRDSLPQVEDAVKVETAADKAKREAREAAQAALDAIMGGEQAEPVQQAQAA